MKNFFKKLWNTMLNPKYEKYFLIGLPCTAILIAALLIVPGAVRAGSPVIPQEEAAVSAESNNAIKAESSEPEAADKAPDIPKKETDIKAEPSDIKPSDKRQDKPVPAPQPTPDPYKAGKDAVIIEEAEHVEIENIEAVITVVDDTELCMSEIAVPSAPEAPAESEPQYMSTPPEARGRVNIVVVETVPELDSEGKQTYRYNFVLGPGGNLVLSSTGEESNVIPMDEDGDGVPEYGMYFYIPQTPEEGTESEITANGYYKSIDIYNADGTPCDKYKYESEPVMTETNKKIGWQEFDGNKYYYDDGKMVSGLKNIDGRLYYFDKNGVMASSLGIDVSFYNENIDWSAVKAQGIDYAIIRVGGRGWESGVVYNDSMFRKNIEGAKAAGLKVGVYFYSTAINEREAVEEASYALQKTRGIDLDMPIFIDMEFSGDRPNGRSDRLTPGQRTVVVNAFCETVANSGREAGVYSGQYFYRDQMELGRINGYTTWLASYTSNNRLPDFKGRYDIWQFTDRGTVDGINGYVDMNVIF